MKRFHFRNAPFDIAPRAQRYTATAWRIFGIGLLFLVACAGLLAYTLQELQSARTAQTSARTEHQVLADAQRAAQARQNDPLVLEKVKAQHRLQQMIRMSWFGLFDALETAARDVRGGVSLLSLVPSPAQTDATQVRLTAVAANTPVMLKYLRLLRKDPRILSAELNSQQPDENVGPGVIRMQLTVLWNPQALLQAPATPENKTIDRGLVANATTIREPVAKVVVSKEVP